MLLLTPDKKHKTILPRQLIVKNCSNLDQLLFIGPSGASPRKSFPVKVAGRNPLTPTPGN
jgi:hypothetical protein